jgi:protocatechuate 3,4-dioxygenase beta subunit
MAVWLMTVAASLAVAAPAAPARLSSAGSGDEPRFAPPPGEETGEVGKLIDHAAASLRSGKSTTDILTDPSYLPAHPFPRFRRLVRQSGRSSRLTLVTPAEPGAPLTVTARVVDREGRPMGGARVYVYHTSSRGWYAARAAHVAAPEGDRKHARLFGYLVTDGDGRFELRTIRPGGYPGSDLPQHIHVEVEPPRETVTGLVTEILFEDDPRLTPAARKRSEQEGFVIARVQRDRERGQRVSVELKVR